MTYDERLAAAYERGRIQGKREAVDDLLADRMEIYGHKLSEIQDMIDFAMHHGYDVEGKMWRQGSGLEDGS